MSHDEPQQMQCRTSDPAFVGSSGIRSEQTNSANVRGYTGQGDEVVSVKPSKPGATGGGIKPLPGGQGICGAEHSRKNDISLTLSVAEVADKRGPGSAR
jgi:hypothetical protein